MAYNATGTASADSLDQSANTGPGTIVGLGGDDSILTGTGLVSVSGDSGNDSVLLQIGNTGTVNGGSENDTVTDDGTAAIGSMQLFGGSGDDLIVVAAAVGAVTIVGGNDSSDGNDTLGGGAGDDIIFGNGGDDILGGSFSGDRDTLVGGFGGDSMGGGDIGNLVFGNQGNDFFQSQGADTFFGGLGNDFVILNDGASPQLFLNEGSDTVGITSTYAGSLTVVGGNDSADGDDSIVIGTGAGFIFGNGGADTLFFDTIEDTAVGHDSLDSTILGGANDTGVGGAGNDCIDTFGGNNLLFGNEGNDTIGGYAPGANTVFGGIGNDSIRMTSASGPGRDTLQGNEGNDTIRGGVDIDTIAGGSGNDVFAYSTAADDGNNAAGGGPVELITDVAFGADRFDTAATITFATNIGAGTGGDLNASANNAIASATALNGGTNTVAAQFTFGGRTYVAINLANNGFLDADDLLLDITGATGAISGSSFI